MPRLGELLVAAGLLTADQVEQALRAQVMWGGRLGTNLVELHMLELDPLSRMLGRQHHLPSVLARHFEKADPDLQRMLSADFAERFSCVPVLRMGPDRHIVIAASGPLLPRQLAIIADELAVEVERLVPAIAPELRVRYQLERVYGIRRAARFLRARGKSIPPFPDFHVLPVQPEPEVEVAPALPTTTREMDLYRPGDPVPPGTAGDADDDVATAAWAKLEWRSLEDQDDQEEREALAPDDEMIPVEVVAPTGPIITVPDDPIDLSLHAALEDELAMPDDATDPLGEPLGDAPDDGPASGRERRTYVRTLADAQGNDVDGQALLGRIAIRKVAVGSAPRVLSGATLGEATRAIRRSTGRDRVADLVLDTLDRFTPACEAAILLVVRGATAIGWKGFLRGGGALGEIAVPMEDGGLVPRAVELNVTMRKSCSELEAIDRLLLASLGRQGGDLVVVPISIADQVMCVIAIATAENAPLASAEPIAAAAGAAFARLMRDASR
ncbi:MAG TPA: hypothetical protein VGD80_28625 [Kofleriaceae bacterium]